MALCSGCGNEIDDPEHCPVCEAGRAHHRPRVVVARCQCPRCADTLAEEDWEGTTTLVCPSCRGTFFPGRSLETVLNKLRATCDPVDVDTVMRDFKDRFTRELPDAVRYKQCPVCDGVMLRRNYATVSGVIVDCCNDHGTWVDETAFAGLADFISRGGDLLADEAGKVRARMTGVKRADGSASGGPTLLERFFGTR